MPFDFPSIEPESLLGDSEEILQRAKWIGIRHSSNGRTQKMTTVKAFFKKKMQKQYSLFLKISNTSITVKKTTKPEEVDVPPIKGS